MNRRRFIRSAAGTTLAAALTPAAYAAGERSSEYVRLGGPLFEPYNGPDGWAGLLHRLGYRAAYCPVGPGEDEATVRAYRQAAAREDIVIAEVGAWSNPISPDREEASAALEKCIKALELADRIGANCCVNISGSRNPDHWAGPHRDNLSDDTFDLVVETTRKIIDAVGPTRTHFTLEAMPWSFPDSTDSYLRLLKAVDRKRFGVHLDPVNMITSVRDYFYNGRLIKDMFARLRPHIRSCHAKDITLREDNYIPQLDEVRPGLGDLDYGTFLKELSRLDDIPLMMEHLQTAAEYALAADHIRSVGKTVRVPVSAPEAQTNRFEHPKTQAYETDSSSYPDRTPGRRPFLHRTGPEGREAEFRLYPGG